ncbi:hypothetical protein A0J48_019110 [Sphaerospermopsis aphanizomenoides BCCUSP55]|uniref:hypothetical protein n=1 Tax=Sphaerospermopsis aphanizomenoides TaxID=459663 RepID=UPI0019079CD0|nr:hypothetical protein [Sphaerospermopsis aphanizomenoides]MBK1989616.1 hypothetical protein [Sphaerospermopsis aphanizomenoides BCCUSP55]
MILLIVPGLLRRYLQLGESAKHLKSAIENAKLARLKTNRKRHIAGKYSRGQGG